MNELQSWVLLLLLAALAARGVDRLRLLPTDLTTMGIAIVIAMLQRVFLDQVALDDPLFAPVLLALPIIAACRGDLRDGLAAAIGTWLALTLVAAAMPIGAANDLPHENYALAAVLAALTAGAAASLPPARRIFGPIFGLGWLGFFLVHDARLAASASVASVVFLTVAWSYLGTVVFGQRAKTS